MSVFFIPPKRILSNLSFITSRFYDFYITNRRPAAVARISKHRGSKFGASLTLILKLNGGNDHPRRIHLGVCILSEISVLRLCAVRGQFIDQTGLKRKHVKRKGEWPPTPTKPCNKIKNLSCAYTLMTPIDPIDRRISFRESLLQQLNYLID